MRYNGENALLEASHIQQIGYEPIEAAQTEESYSQIPHILFGLLSVLYAPPAPDAS